MQDEQAVARLKQGDLASLEVLVSRYYLPAVRAAYLILHDREQAEDIVQNAFLRLNETIRQYDTKRPFGPWFMRCVVNAAINTNHRESRLIPLEPEQDADGFSTADWLLEQIPDPAEQAEAAEKREAIWQALEQLTPNQRAAVVMRYYLELSESEMAAQLDCPRSSLKWWLHSARMRLRELLQAFGPLQNSKEKRQ